LTYGVFGSDIVFGDVEAFIDRRAVAAAFEWRATDDLTLQVGGGVGHGGRLILDDDVHHEILPGWLATLSGSYRVLRGGGPFVLLSGNWRLRRQHAPVRRRDHDLVTALGLRFDRADLLRRLSPYLASALEGHLLQIAARTSPMTSTTTIAFGVAACCRGFDLWQRLPSGRSATVSAGVACEPPQS
jgi:hypothetical protein